MPSIRPSIAFGWSPAGSNGESTMKTPSLPELLESLLPIIGTQPPLIQTTNPSHILRLQDLAQERNLLLRQLHGTINAIDGWAKISRHKARIQTPRRSRTYQMQL